MKAIIQFVIALHIILPATCFCQPEQKFFISFKDKANSQYSINRPTEFLSTAAIERRIKAGISITEEDLPVNQNYIDSVLSTGAQFMYSSKWLNGILVQVSDSLILNRIDSFSFVVKKNAVGKRENASKLPLNSLQSLQLDYGFAKDQIAMANGEYLHERGFLGDGMKIAILDLGFLNFNRLPNYQNLYWSNQILATHDFVNGGDSVYDAGTHGSLVASTIIGQQQGEFIGTAPNANLVLIRTENEYKEEVLEEYNWVAGAEYADAIGCDLLNSSLGYYTFDNPAQDHTYADLDGETCIATIGANKAASKGMLLCISAGNEGNDTWHYIGTPADAKGVLTVGAVKSDRYAAPFSSFGPSADGRVKPEVSILGKDAAVINTNGLIKKGSGTSFSSPILCGLAACLWQKHPEKTAMQIREAIIQSASLFDQPDNQRGYGIPNFGIADALLSGYDMLYDSTHSLLLYPNPCTEFTRLIIKSDYPQKMNLKIYNTLGQVVINKVVYSNEGSGFLTTEIVEISNLTSATYYLVCEANGKTNLLKFIK